MSPEKKPQFFLNKNYENVNPNFWKAKKRDVEMENLWIWMVTNEWKPRGDHPRKGLNAN